jgi:hypothetical protein
MPYGFSILSSALPPLFEALFFDAPLPFRVAADLVTALLEAGAGNEPDMRSIADSTRVKPPRSSG